MCSATPIALAALTAPAAAGPAEAALVLERLEAAGPRLVVVVANRGETPSGEAELVLTTRAGGRLVGSTRIRVEPVEPGASREERVLVSVWGADRPDLRAALERQGCCTTRISLEPGTGPPAEIRHGLEPDVAATPP